MPGVGRRGGDSLNGPERVEDRPLTIPSVVDAARRRLPREILDYVEGGAGSEATLRRNRDALDDLQLQPRVLRDVRDVDIHSSMLGTELSTPVVLSPVGSLSLVHPDGVVGAARAAAAAGTSCIVGMLAQPGFDVVATSTTSDLAFQLYVRGDEDWLSTVLSRIEDLGYGSVHLTVDSPVFGLRERDVLNGFSAAAAVDRPGVLGLPAGRRDRYQAATTWQTLDTVRRLTPLPLVLKGVMSPEDAVTAVEHGVDGICVSNHGGRQLDHAAASIEQLPVVVEAIGGAVEVGVDSGFMRGVDVVKAVALGAHWVGIGKLQALALAAGGEDCLTRTLELLSTEIRTTLALVGCRRLAELRPTHVRGA